MSSDINLKNDIFSYTPVKCEKVLKTIDYDPNITTSIIVPAFNEAEGLPIVLDKIFKNTNGEHEVLVIDDGSDDGTATIACKYPCKVISHRRNYGKGTALMTGIRYSRCENLIFIDSDDTYPTEAIPQITDELVLYDLVYGTRTYGRYNIPFFNRFGNMILQNMIRHIYNYKISDFSTGLYGLKRRHFENMELSNTGICIESEIAIKACRMQLQMKEIPIAYRPRIGKSKLPRLAAGFGNLRNIIGYIFWHPTDKLN